MQRASTSSVFIFKSGFMASRVTMAVVFILAVFAPSARAQIAARAGDVTDDPQSYFLSHVDSAEQDLASQGIVEFDCSHCSAMNDLLFITLKAGCGNAGCSYDLFRKESENSYRYLTNVWLHHAGFQFLPTKHNGMNDILCYGHMSASEGQLFLYEFDGKDYKRSGENETIASADFKTRITPEHVQQIYFSVDEIRKPGLNTPEQSTPPRQLTLIQPDDSEFEPLLNRDFPGLQTLDSYTLMRPFMVLVRNDTPYSVVAYSIESDSKTPYGTVRQEWRFFIQDRFSPAAEERQPFVPGEVRLMVETIDINSSDYTKMSKIIAGTLAFLSSHAPPALSCPIILDSASCGRMHDAKVDAVIYADGTYVGPDHMLILQRYKALTDADREEGESLLKLLGSNPTSDDIVTALEHDIQENLKVNLSPTHDPDVLYQEEHARYITQAAQSLQEVYRRRGSDALKEGATAMANSVSVTMSPSPAN